MSFHFVPHVEESDPASSQHSIRSRELQRAEVRSHAARISHQARRSPANLLIQRETQGSEESSRSVAGAVQISYEGHLDQMVVNRQLVQDDAELSRTMELVTSLDKFWPIFRALSLHATSAFCSALKVRTPIPEGFFAYMQDTAMFHIGAAYFYYENDCLTRSDTRPSRLVLSHLNAGMSIIRTRLRDDSIVQTCTVLAILLIPFCEDTNELDMTQATAHWRAAATLLSRKIQQVGLENTFENYSLESIGDLMDSWGPCLRCWLGSDFTLQDQTLPKALTLSADDFDLSLLPRGLMTLLELGLAGRTTCALALNLLDLLGGNQVRPAADELSFSTSKTWDLSAIRPPNPDGSSSTETIVVQALQSFCARLIGLPLGVTSPIPRISRHQLTNALENCRAEKQAEAEERALFWAWLVALDLWRTSFGVLFGAGTSLRAMHLERSAWVNCTTVAKDVLRDFFADDRLIKCYEQIFATSSDEE